MLDKLKVVLRACGIVAIVAALVLLWLFFAHPETEVETMKAMYLQTQDDADVTILMNRGYTVMIDTGEEQDFSHIDEVLKAQQISQIDCLILTHFDKDHIGSALKLAQTYPIKRVIEPYFTKENTRKDALDTYLEQANIERVVLSRKRDFTYGDLRVRIYPPNEFEYKKDNNYSLAVEIKHKDVDLFFAGDAMKKRTEELLEYPLNQADCYHMSDHGRDYEGSEALLDKLNPSNLIVTSDHLGTNIQKVIQEANIPVFYTLHQDQIFLSDGTEFLHQN